MRMKKPKPLARAGVTMLIALCGSLAFADVASGVRYTLPSGWSAVDEDGVRILSPNDQKAGEMMKARILGVQAAAGAPEEQIAELAASINADAKVISTSKLESTDRGDAGKFYIVSFDVESLAIGAHTRMLAILVRDKQRAVLLLLFTDNAVLRKHAEGLQELLKSIEIDPKAATTPLAKPSKPPAATAGTGEHLPTGDTPDRFPGSPEWLPSGRGVAIPVARVVQGSPQGLWWHYQVRGKETIASTTIFLEDGTRATNPRPGSGELFDVEGQRKQRGNTGVGTFSVKDGEITQTADGFTRTEAFKSGKGEDGEWIEIGAGRHYALEPATAKGLLGKWQGGGQRYIFRADGTFVTGTDENAGAHGTWQLDGYLFAICPSDRPRWISLLGRTGKFIVIGSTVYARE